MKTKITLRLAVIVTLLLAAFTSATKMQAQLSCPYKIINNLACSITVSYIAYDCGGNTLCGASSQAIAPGSSFVMPTSCCAQACDIDVTVLTIGGISVTQTPSVVNMSNTSGSGPGVSGCLFTPPNWTIQWTLGNTKVF